MRQRISSFAQPGLGLVLFDNNRLERLRFEDDIENEASTELCIASMRRFAELWRPDRFTVTLAALDLGGPADPRREVHVEGDPIVQVPSGDMIAALQTSVHGWNRIALPDGLDLVESWQAVSADGMWPHTATVRAAPRLAGHATVWLRLDEALPASHCLLQVYSLGDAEMRTMIGPSFFNPGNDPRPADYEVYGRPLAEWQRANLAIYDETIAVLQELGWHR